jgi:hypothetical protein
LNLLRILGSIRLECRINGTTTQIEAIFINFAAQPLSPSTRMQDGRLVAPESRLDSTGIYTLQAMLKQMLGDDATLV